MNPDLQAQHLQPKNQSHYLAKVVSRFEDNTENSASNPRNYKIKFTILGLPDFTDDYPVASLLGNSTRPVEEGDLVKIWDICELVDGMHTFFYEPVFEDRFTGLKNYDNEVNITEKNVAHVKLPNMEITMDRHAGAGGGDDQNDLSDGSGKVEIKLPECTITYDGDGKSVTIDATSRMNLTTKGPLNIKATGNIQINTPQGGPSFCAIPICPYTGASHTINIVPTA